MQPEFSERLEEAAALFNASLMHSHNRIRLGVKCLEMIGHLDKAIQPKENTE
jgi:hypothetical protein